MVGARCCAALIGPRRLHGEESSNRIGDLEEGGLEGGLDAYEVLGLLGLGIGW